MKATTVPDEHQGQLCGRPRLLDAIDKRLIEHRLILIQAMAGAGKSILVDQWTAHRRLHQPDELIVRIEHDQVPDDMNALVRGLVEDGPGVLVVDDAELLAPSVLDHLDRLLAGGPPDVRVVLAGRTKPTLSLARLGLDGHVAHLDASDLALRIDELTDLVTTLTGAPPTPDLGRWLLHETEGWVAGVKLLATGPLRTQNGEESHLDRPGNFRVITDYLVEQALEPLPDELRQFVLATSVPDRLEADLCSALAGSVYGQRNLEELERRNLFLVPLDDRRVAYRYHRMFRDVMRHHFRNEHQEACREAQLRGAQWCLANGDLRSGIDLLVKAGAWRAVVDAVSSHQADLVSSGLGRYAVDWLTAVPADVLEEDPHAAMMLAFLLRVKGDLAGAEAIILRLDQNAHEGRIDHDLHERLTAGWKAAGLAWGTPLEDALEGALAVEAALMSTEGRRQHSGDLPKYRQHRTQLVGYRVLAAEALFHLRRREEAATWAAHAVEAAGHDPMLRATALSIQAYIDARRGSLVAAAAAAAESQNLNDGVRFHAVAMDPGFALAEVAYAVDDLDRAEVLLAGLEEHARSMHAATRVAQVALARAAVALGRGRSRDGLSVLAEYHRERWPALPDGLGIRFHVLTACIRIIMGDVAGGRRELRASGLTLESAPGAFVTLAAVERDRDAMQIIVDSWPDSPSLRMQSHYLVARALLADINGDLVERRRHIEAVSALVVPEGYIRPVVDLAPSVAPLIAKVVGEAASGDLLVLGEMAAAATRPDERRPVGRFSNREAAVLDQLITDLTNPEIAEALEISPNTLKTYLRRIYQKLGVSSRRDAVRRAVDLGMLMERRWGS